ncbi:MAG: 23S rRNA (uracil(1939)-C(5))-methyltransferase RlmD [Firmicutes bacterium HGW-Firmicutes-12]|nr:MAG: 23S rRNA (uracil(1939)-C(5))-methyltransferase RlmD [Firmicutes bacterium HGW-Firmicutes-12]
MTLVNGKQYKIDITGYTHDGAGVGRINGQVVFVPGALRGEEILVEIVSAKKGIVRGKTIEVITSHPGRVEPECPVYSSCGGCRLQHVSYTEQLKIKDNLVRDTLKRIGGLDDLNIQPVWGMEHPWGYRNKGHFHVGIVDNKIVLGFYEEESHDITPQPCRFLFSKEINKLLSFLEELLNKYKLNINARDSSGLRWIMLRESHSSGEIIVTFISKGEFSSEKEAISQEICRNFSRVVGVCLNYNEKMSGQVLGERTKKIRGKDRIEDRLDPFIYSLSIHSFFQINNIQAQKLYEKTVKLAGFTGTETVIDAYCGTGSISLFLAKKAKKVIGIEVVKEAVEDAWRNAGLNNIQNIEFLKGEAEKIMPILVRKGIRPNVVVVDPPRRGCGKALLESILEVMPERVVYVSCNPATLARDLKHLVAGGYEVREVQPVDMFPQTAHVECVVLMCASSEAGKC